VNFLLHAKWLGIIRFFSIQHRKTEESREHNLMKKPESARKTIAYDLFFIERQVGNRKKHETFA
jgi:hypothetical protein